MVQYFKIPCHDFNRRSAAVLSLAQTHVLLSIIQDVLEVRTKLVSQTQEEVDEQLLGQARKKNWPRSPAASTSRYEELPLWAEMENHTMHLN